MINKNAMAYEITQRMVAQAEILNVSVEKLSCGSTVIDTGIEVSGSFEAGRLFSEACMGGLGKVGFRTLNFNGFSLPGVNITVGRPVEACMAAQYAGWFVNAQREDRKDFQAMGSGPARSLYGKEALLQELCLTETSDVAVLALESHISPDDAVACWIAERCGVLPERLTLLVAPTASLVGSIQVAARVVETGLHKMIEVGFDIKTILSGFGVCPIAPIAQDNLRAIGRTNDAVLYGGQVWYTTTAGEEKVEEIINKLPASSSKDYGTPFYDLFKRYNFNFYKIDPFLFSPAEIYINDLTSGRTFHAGQTDTGILKKMFRS